MVFGDRYQEFEFILRLIRQIRTDLQTQGYSVLKRLKQLGPYCSARLTLRPTHNHSIHFSKSYRKKTTNATNSGINLSVFILSN